jgi:hypothetical protein
MSKLLTVKVTGIKEIKDELKQLTDDIKAEAYETLITMSRVEIETKAKQAVPVDTGRLKSSIMTIHKERTTYNYTDRKGKKGRSYDGRLQTVQPKDYEVFVGTNVEYANKIHENGGGGVGSRRTVQGQKRPKGYGRYYLKNAFDAAVPKIIKALRRIRGIE